VNEHEALEQAALERAIANSEHHAAWFRPKKKRNGRVLSWRVKVVGTDDLEIRVWPSGYSYVVKASEPTVTAIDYNQRVHDPKKAVRIAESLAGLRAFETCWQSSDTP
jgi:hypothetical protein